MKDIMDIIDYAEISTIMNIIENFYIYLYKKSNLLMEEQKTDEILFEIAITHNTTHAPINTANIIQITLHIT
jgi:hypothetical protein